MPEFQSFYQNKINLTSWKIQEDLIKISADLVTETIVGQIIDTRHFALMVDEARSHKQEQLSVCVRYAVGLDIYERFLQFIDVSCGQNANQIVSAIYSSFKNCNLNMDTLNIVAQSYDGASVMSGHIGGVQVKIKEDYLYAIYTHCMAHRLNLVVVDLCKEIKVFLKYFFSLGIILIYFNL